MRSAELLVSWKLELSQRVGRSEASILGEGLLVGDFPESSVRIVFEDGSDLTFRRSFYLGDIDKRTVDKSVCRVAVFSEHVGHHEFWIGPEDHIEVLTQRKQPLTELLAICVPDAPQSDEDRAWDNMAPVGREFGSPDCERLADNDRAVFQSNLSSLIRECSELADARSTKVGPDERQDALNVQGALQELGQHVSLEVAAEVWRHHSSSLAAAWMSGAETVNSAKNTLYFYCANDWCGWGGRIHRI